VIQRNQGYPSVPGVGEMAGWSHHKTIETSEQILHSFIDKKVVFALCHKTDRKIIGSLGLHYSWANEDEKYKELKVKDIGYVLSKIYWGQGLMPEAVCAVMDYGIKNLSVEAFTCGHFVENNQSRRVIEKCGFIFVREGEYYSKQLDKCFQDMKYILIAK
jgi:ribosomal-protein-alanine N-acetyltransferase